MTTYSSILAWRIPWTQEPEVLQSMGFQRVGHDLVTQQQQASQCHFHIFFPYGSSIFFFFFNETTILFCIVAASIHISINSIQEFPFLHILINMYYL